MELTIRASFVSSLFEAWRVVAGLDLGSYLPAPASLEIHAGYPGSQQSQGHWFRHCCVLGINREDYTVVPEVTVRVEPKGDIITVLEISIKCLQLCCGESDGPGRGHGGEASGP